jgi:hypothetical protein
VGQKVQAYNPATKTVSTQTVQQVFLNQDTDPIDVTLAVHPAGSRTKPQQVAVASHGSHAPPVQLETVHTTQKHPWLTTRGWITAGQLHLGDQVQQLDGGTATVVGLKLIAGAAAMYDLAVSNVHIFAVGSTQVIVHNCGGGPPDGWEKMDYGSDNKEGVSDFTHIDESGNRLEATLYHDSGELQISWMDSLSQAKEHLPKRTDWLGDSVQTVKGYVSDHFGTYFAPPSRGVALVNRMFSSTLNASGFAPGVIQTEGSKIWLVFQRLANL